MATRERPADRGRRQAQVGLRRVGSDLRIARLGAGVSLRVAGAAAGISHTQFATIERGEARKVSLDTLSRCCAAVGLDVVVRAYPAGDPIRDRAHAALLERFRVHLHPSLRWQTEVPLDQRGDLRAWDAVVSGRGWHRPIEAEMRLADSQALTRKLNLKARDGNEPHPILLVADTRNNRRAMSTLRAALGDAYPLDPRRVLAALRAGRDPGAGGVVII